MDFHSQWILIIRIHFSSLKGYITLHHLCFSYHLEIRFLLLSLFYPWLLPFCPSSCSSGIWRSRLHLVFILLNFDLQFNLFVLKLFLQLLVNKLCIPPIKHFSFWSFVLLLMVLAVVTSCSLCLSIWTYISFKVLSPAFFISCVHIRPKNIQYSSFHIYHSFHIYL